MTFQTMLSTMGGGMLRTIGIFCLTLVGSIPLGVIVMLLRQSKLKVLSWITKAFIAIIRGTPLMLQLLIWYFGPFYLFGISIRGWRFPALIVGFVVNYACYFAEIYRGGIESMPIGQYEAAEVLGYSKAQTFFKIILPQVFKRILPSITNEVITLVKDTALVTAIGVTEILYFTKSAVNRMVDASAYIVAALFYLVLNFAVTKFFDWMEKRSNYIDMAR